MDQLAEIEIGLSDQRLMLNPEIAFSDMPIEKILSIRVLECEVIWVGDVIWGTNEVEYIWSRKSAVLWSFSYFSKSWYFSYFSMWCCGVVVITTAKLHSTKPELRFWAVSNPAHGSSEICDGEDLWQLSWLEIRLIAFRQSTIPRKQFIIMLKSPSKTHLTIMFLLFDLVISMKTDSNFWL